MVSSVLVASNSSSSSSGTLGVSSLPGTRSGADKTQQTPSSSLHTAETLASDTTSSQQGTKASPVDPTQFQANAMLSQAGLPQKTGNAVPQSQTESGRPHAGLSQSLGLSDMSAQSSQTGAKSSPDGIPEDWDWQTYLQLNPDVAAALGQDPASAKQHWQDWGRLEKRRYKVVSTAVCQQLLQILSGLSLATCSSHGVVTWMGLIAVVSQWEFGCIERLCMAVLTVLACVLSNISSCLLNGRNVRIVWAVILTSVTLFCYASCP